MRKPQVIEQKDLQTYKKRAAKVIDAIDIWAESLCGVEHPEYDFSPNKENLVQEWVDEEYTKSGGKDAYGSWIFYEEESRLLHTLSEDAYFRVLSNRNQNVLTRDDLNTIRKSKICIFGQSIGGNVAVLCAHSGFGTLSIADFDTLDPTNLNRVYYGTSEDVGRLKVDIVAERMWSINPYMNIDISNTIIDESNLDIFLTDGKVIVELIDDFFMKVKIREVARAKKIPVVMTTNLGRRMLIDIERYDLAKETKLFNGLVEEGIFQDILDHKMDPEDIVKYAKELVGKENVDPRALASLALIGKPGGLHGRPQIMPTVASNSGMAVTLVQWILGCYSDYNTLRSGRYLFDPHIFFNN